MEVLVPASELTPGTSYWIRASYPGSSSSDIVMKRKNMDYAAVKAATTSSDFSTRYSENYGKALADHRFASEFSLNSLGAYSDDSEGLTYEMRVVDAITYLVFIMTVVKISLAMDEANLYD